MKTIAGAALRAWRNSRRMRAAPRPANISTNEEADCAKKRRVRLVRHGLGEQRLAGAGRAVQQDALRHLRAELAEALRVAHELHDLAQLVLRLLDALHVLPADGARRGRRDLLRLRPRHVLDHPNDRDGDQAHEDDRQPGEHPALHVVPHGGAAAGRRPPCPARSGLRPSRPSARSCSRPRPPSSRPAASAPGSLQHGAERVVGLVAVHLRGVEHRELVGPGLEHHAARSAGCARSGTARCMPPSRRPRSPGWRKRPGRPAGRAGAAFGGSSSSTTPIGHRRPRHESYNTLSSRGLALKLRPALAQSRPSTLTTSAVKSFAPWTSDDPTP